MHRRTTPVLRARPRSTANSRAVFGRAGVVALLAIPLVAVALPAPSAQAVSTALPGSATTTAVVGHVAVHRQTGNGYWLQGGAVDPSANRLYLADSTAAGDPSLVIVELDTNSARSVVLGGPAGAFAMDAAVSPIDGSVYVVQEAPSAVASVVSIVNPDADYTASTPPAVSVGFNAQKIDVGGDGRAYVTSLNDGTVSVLGPAGGLTGLSVVQTLTGLATAGATTALDTARGVLYIASEYTNTVTSIDVSASPAAVIGTFAVDDAPTGIAVDAATGDLVIVTSDSNSVSWFTPAADRGLAAPKRTEQLATDASDTSGAFVLPLSASVRADGSTLVVSQVNGATDSFVTVIPAVVDAQHPVRMVAVGNLAFWGIEDTRAGGTLYVPNSGNGHVSIISDVTLAAVPTTVSYGARTSLYATLTRSDGQPITASVVFTDAGGASLGSASVDANGLASRDLGVRPVGDVQFSASVGTPSTLSLAVSGSATTSKAPTATTVVLDRASVWEGADAAATVSVVGAHGSSGTAPTGAVTLRDSAGAVVARAVLDAGSSRVVLSGLSAGTARLTATYDGDNSYVASTSAGVDLTVAARTPDLDLDDPDLTVGGDVTLQLTGFAPNESVDLTLHSDPIWLGSATMNATGSGSFAFVTPVVDPGTHTIIAVGAASGRTVSFSVTVAQAPVAVLPTPTPSPSATSTPTPAPTRSPAAGGSTPAASPSTPVSNQRGALASTGVDPIGSGVTAGGLALLGLGVVMIAIRRTRRSLREQVNE